MTSSCSYCSARDSIAPRASCSNQAKFPCDGWNTKRSIFNSVFGPGESRVPVLEDHPQRAVGGGTKRVVDQNVLPRCAGIELPPRATAAIPRAVLIVPAGSSSTCAGQSVRRKRIPVLSDAPRLKFAFS